MSTKLLNDFYAVNVNISYGQLQPWIDWCDRNCTGEWKYSEDPDGYWSSWTFFFESERDYCAFLLWNKI